MRLKLVKKLDSSITNFLLIIRNKKYIRNASSSKKIIRLPEHLKWICRFFNKKGNQIYLICDHSKKIGYIRLEKKNNFFTVSWALIKAHSNKGIMSKSLKKITSNKSYKYKALIKAGNVASSKVALKAGFYLIKKKRGREVYHKN